MKDITQLTNDNVDRLLSILLDRNVEMALVTRAADNHYVVAEYARKRPLPYEETKFDYVRMYITIDEQFTIHNNWGYHQGGNEAIAAQHLHNAQYMYKYLLEQGFDIHQDKTT